MSVQLTALNVVDRVSVLRRVELFAGTPGRVLSCLAEVSDELLVAPGGVVLSQGDIGDTLVVVLEGSLVADLNGSEVARFDLGAVIGEFAVFVPEPRSATVRAVSQCRLLSISKMAVDELLLDYPEVSRSVIVALVRRFQQRNHELTQLHGNNYERGAALESIEVNTPLAHRETVMAVLSVDNLSLNNLGSDSGPGTGRSTGPGSCSVHEATESVAKLLIDLRDDPRAMWNAPWLARCSAEALRVHSSVGLGHPAGQARTSQG